VRYKTNLSEEGPALTTVSDLSGELLVCARQTSFRRAHFDEQGAYRRLLATQLTPLKSKSLNTLGFRIAAGTRIVYAFCFRVTSSPFTVNALGLRITACAGVFYPLGLRITTSSLVRSLFFHESGFLPLK
jgi:hypothetical protein